MDDALALLREKRWRGAMYLAGYAVECLLKTRLLLRFGCRTLKELEGLLIERKFLGEDNTIFTHQIEILLRLTDSIQRLSSNPARRRDFHIVNTWIPAWRYNGDGSNSNDANDFLQAVKNLTHWIESNT